MFVAAHRAFPRIEACALAAGFALLAASGAHAQTNLVTNGSFSNALNGSAQTTSTEIGGAGSYGGLAQNIQGWTSAGYAFVFVPGTGSPSGTTADTTGATSGGGLPNLYLWGPGSGATTLGSPSMTTAPGASGGTDNGQAGVANGLTNSPDGGNFIASDGDSGISNTISQSIAGLQVGGVYKLSFYWGAAEQEGTSYEAPTTNRWQVSLGSQTLTTNTITNPAQGFSGWQTATLLFSATATTETLSFLAKGTPNGVPPFALLDGVMLVAAPEPATWTSLGLGLAAACILVRRRASRSPADAA